MMPSCGLINTALSWNTSQHTLHNIVSSFWENHEKYKYVIHNNIEKIRRYYCYKFVDHLRMINRFGCHIQCLPQDFLKNELSSYNPNNILKPFSQNSPVKYLLKRGDKILVNIFILNDSKSSSWLQSLTFYDAS